MLNKKQCNDVDSVDKNAKKECKRLLVYQDSISCHSNGAGTVKTACVLLKMTEQKKNIS